jgi:hypothetical protein
MGGLMDDGRIDSREIVGNDNSLSRDLDEEEFFISFSGILLLLELVD